MTVFILSVPLQIGFQEMKVGMVAFIRAEHYTVELSKESADEKYIEIEDGKIFS